MLASRCRIFLCQPYDQNKIQFLLHLSKTTASFTQLFLPSCAEEILQLVLHLYGCTYNCSKSDEARDTAQTSLRS